MKLIVTKGTTSFTAMIFIQDSSSTTGAGLTGLAYNSASLTWYYRRQDAGNAGGTAVTLATATKGTWTSGGFVEVDSTNMPGMYEIGIPNAALATGASWVLMELKGATNMAQLPIEIQLVSFDLQTATQSVNLVQILGTALTETVSGYLAAGFKKLLDVATPVFTLASIIQTGDSYSRIGSAGVGLTNLGDTRIANLDATVSSRLAPTVPSRTLDVSTGGEAGLDWANVGSPSSSVNLSNTTTNTVTTALNLTNNNDKTGYDLSAGAITSIWAALTSGLTTSGSIGKLIVDNLNATISSVKALLPAALVGGRMDSSLGAIQSGVDFSATMKASLDSSTPASIQGAVGSVTGNVGGNVVGSVGSVSGAVGSVTGSVGGNVTGSVGSLGTTAQANVKTQVVNALTVDTYSEESSIPGTTFTLKQAITVAFMAFRNKMTQTASTSTLRNANDSGTVATSTVSDDGTTFTKGKYS